jgi:hypothetical protein
LDFEFYNPELHILSGNKDSARVWATNLFYDGSLPLSNAIHSLRTRMIVISPSTWKDNIRETKLSVQEYLAWIQYAFRVEYTCLMSRISRSCTSEKCDIHILFLNQPDSVLTRYGTPQAHDFSE